MKKVTADTITDDQIRAAPVTSGWRDAALSQRLAKYLPVTHREARVHCADAWNSRHGSKP